LAFLGHYWLGQVWQDPCQGTGLLLMRPSPCNCKHSSAPHIAGSFVCAKIRDDDVCNVGKSKSLGGCGSAGYGRITGQIAAPNLSEDRNIVRCNARPSRGQSLTLTIRSERRTRTGFSDIARAVRSLSERNEIPSNYQKCPGCVRRLETWPRSCWRFDVESIDCPLPMLPNGAGASDQNDAGSETRWRQPPVDRVTLCDVRAPTGVD
jgi:hypothetical protein